MDVTVSICTRNRSDALQETLRSIAALEIPAGLRWELLVIDNGSTDATPHVLQAEQAAGRLPLRVASEPRPGIARARNRSLTEARGRLMVVTDDDVTPRPGWLRAYVEAAARWPEAGFFGGRTWASFEAPVPAWLADALPAVRAAYALVDGGVQERALAKGEDPFGANMALRRAAVGDRRYDVRLGYQPGHNISGEETALVRAMRAAGSWGVYVPDALVAHRIPAARLTLDHIELTGAAYGCSKVVLRPERLGYARRLRLKVRLARCALRLAWQRASGATPRVWVRTARKRAVALGELAAMVERP